MSSPETSPTPKELINVTDITISDRIRKDLGDIASLKSSIKEFGIIQPIILTRDGNGRPELVAGGRRLASLTQLGVTSLLHGREFIWRGEEDALTRKAVELEENLRRKSLTWHEEVLAKQELLKLMEAKHGVATLGRPSRADIRSGNTGFGVRKLAEMLGESPATTSNDLQVAQMLTAIPELKRMPTKQDAMRKLNVATTILTMQGAIQAGVAPGAISTTSSAATPGTLPASAKPVFPSSELPYKVIGPGPYEAGIFTLAPASCDLVLTDLPYDIGLGDGSAAHSAGLQGFVDSNTDIVTMCRNVAEHSWRILKENRYAVIFFGAAYFEVLKTALEVVGFIVDPYWFIWRRNRTAPPSPTRYAKCYDPALICSKGSPTLLRPNLGNFLDVPSVTGSDRLHAAQKPVEVMEHFVLDMTAERSTVVDMMAGSGTTGVAAIRNKRYCILFEREASNITLINARLGDALRQVK
jgi:ParB/RepB/Spo0J family partition protein